MAQGASIFRAASPFPLIMPVRVGRKLSAGLPEVDRAGERREGSVQSDHLGHQGTTRSDPVVPFSYPLLSRVRDVLVRFEE